jgi:S-(hydroxymethyl)glutathione dehydrogenase/alcohol dehydrogenase
MKAAVCYEFGKPLVVEEIDIDPPQPGEVKVKLAATAICHSDVHLVRGEWDGKLPVVAGHESAGIIAEVGQGVTALQSGDYVVVSLLRSCGRCSDCMSGAPHLCSGSFALDSQSRLHSKHGQAIYHGLKTASFAEYTIVDQSQCVKIPDDIPPESAALLGCGVITGVGAVTNTAKVTPGSRVAIIGVGGVGLNSIQGAVLAEANMIIAVDQVEDKLAVARTVGAPHTVNASTEDPVKAVRALTGGAGVDYAFVTVGSVLAINQAFKMVRRGGSVVAIGLPEVSATVDLRVHSLVSGERRILGSFMGSTRLSADVPKLVDLYQQGRLKLDELISNRYSLEQINEAITTMEHGAALRNVIVFPN